MKQVKYLLRVKPEFFAKDLTDTEIMDCIRFVSKSSKFDDNVKRTNIQQFLLNWIDLESFVINYFE